MCVPDACREFRRRTLHRERNSCAHGNCKKPINFLPAAKSLTNKLSDKTNTLSEMRITCAQESEQYQPRNANQKYYFEWKAQLTADSFLSYMNWHSCFVALFGQSQHIQI